MAYTKTQICNLALSKIGDTSAQITNFEPPDGSEEALLCATFFEPTLREALEMHTWSFATDYTQLAASTTAPPFKYDYSYPLPADCLRPIGCRRYGDSDDLHRYDEWKPVGRNIYTNMPSCYLMYIKYVDDPNQWSALFVKLFYYLLASKLVMPLTEDRNRENDLLSYIETSILPEARRVDSFAGYEYARVNSEWIQASFEGGASADFLRGFEFENYGNLP